MQWLYILAITIPPILLLYSSIVRTLPNYSETKSFKSLYGEISISRTGNAVPQIEATCLEDVFFALGYSHAMDRLWQMDILRRTADGTLSEMLGEDYLPSDIFSRNLQFRHNSHRLSTLSGKSEIYLKRYVEGINTYVDSSYLPIEYFIAWHKWRRWEVVDSLTVWRYLSFMMNQSIESDLLRAELKTLMNTSLKVLPVEEALQFAQYFTVEGNELPREIYKSFRSTEKEKVNDSEPGVFYSSFKNAKVSGNAWVVSGDFTASGKPILACDSHFTSQVPSLLYLVGVRWEKHSVHGGVIPGVPMFLFGTNKFAVWGSTALPSKTIDIYSHTIVASQYLYENTLHNFSTFTETIKVKGKAEIVYEFSNTKSGVLLYGKNLSVRWAADEVLDTSFDGYLQLMMGSNLRNIRVSLEKIVMPTMNFLFATDEGEIAYQAVGVQPLRKIITVGVISGNNSLLRWKEIIPFSEMPYSINPPKGFIVVSNNQPSTYMYKHYESFVSDFSANQATRIDFLLDSSVKSKKKIQVADMLEIQNDEFSDIAATILPIWLGIIKDRLSQSTFATWDYKMRKDSKEAAVFALWFQSFLSELLVDELGSELNSRLVNYETYHNYIIKSFIDGNSLPYCDNVNTVQFETCEELLLISFRRALEKSQKKTWGDLHYTSHNSPVRLKSYIFPYLDFTSYFLLSLPIGGSGSTIHQNGLSWNGDFTSKFGSQARFLVDLGSPSSLWGISTGQSAHPLSPHFSDQFLPFHSGKLFALSSIAKYHSQLVNKW